jgi:hypothetical protein
MNKEKYNEIIDEVYDKYTTKYVGYDDVPPKELFLFEIRTNKEFSEKWGLNIEERGLSYSEREELFNQNRIVILTKGEKIDEQDFDNVEIPTKLITLEYKGTKIETYE